MSPKEIRREAQIVARKLAKQNSWLARRQKTLGQPQKWTMVNARSTSASRSVVVSTKIVSAMLKNGWLKEQPTGGLHLTGAGLKKLLPAKQGVDFAAQHQIRTDRIIKDQQGLTRSVKSNEAESPLGWMRARKDKSGNPLIDDAQFEAGERIRLDFTIAQMSPRVTANWDFSGANSGKGANRGDGAIDISNRAMAARTRFFSALDELGPEMAGIVFDVCCLASGIEGAETRLGWPRRSGKLVLQIALTKLSVHYGIAKSKDCASRTGIISHWGQQGYRPIISPATDNTG